jgi:hypothetical protein
MARQSGINYFLAIFAGASISAIATVANRRFLALCGSFFLLFQLLAAPRRGLTVGP